LKRGTAFAFAAYGLWGFFPIYFKALHGVPALQIMTHRVVWSFVVLAALLLLRREYLAFKASLKPRTVLIYLAAGVLLAVNWLVYVWAVNAGFVLESSLGYFINPLVSVLLGVIFFRERLRPMQWAPIGLAAAAVVYLALSYGSLPWIALSLAFSFGFYGLMKKIAPLSSLHGLSLETAVLFLPALGYLLFAEFNGSGAFMHAGAAPTLFMAFSGLVTVIPLLLFSSAARMVPLSTLGIIQYVAPTLQFLIGVLVFHEPFPRARAVGFVLIWSALAIYATDSLWRNRLRK